MAFKTASTFIFLFSLLFSSYSAPHPIHFFPSSLSPEAPSLSTRNELETKYFTQTLDHFNFHPQSYQTFQQRYLINSSYWGGAKIKAPIFVYTGNEGDIEWFAQNTGFMFDNAPYFQAFLVFIEHRFYGESIPFGGKEVAYSNASTLGYLSSTQALADYATLIIDLKKNLSADGSPVVVFGGSYGGMLAAWFRLKYPHVAIGALASSAPILNFEDITSPYSFNNIITKDFRSESENCYRVIKGSWKEIEDTALQSGGLDKLRKHFRICENYISGNAVENWLWTAYVYTAMTDYPTPSNFLSPLPAYPVKQVLHMLLHILLFQIMCRVVFRKRLCYAHPLVTIVERKDTFVPIARSCIVYPRPRNGGRIFLHPRRLQFGLENLICRRNLLTLC